MKILQRIRARDGRQGHLHTEIDWIKKNGRVYVSADDLVYTLREMEQLNLTESALIQVENIENALAQFTVEARGH